MRGPRSPTRIRTSLYARPLTFFFFLCLRSPSSSSSLSSSLLLFFLCFLWCFLLLPSFSARMSSSSLPMVLEYSLRPPPAVTSGGMDPDTYWCSEDEPAWSPPTCGGGRGCEPGGVGAKGDGRVLLLPLVSLSILARIVLR